MINPIGNYINELKEALDKANISTLKRKAILATICSQWKDRSLESLNHWRSSGSPEYLEHRQFCEKIIKELEAIS